MGGQVILTHDVYDPATISQAAEDYRDHITVTVTQEGPNETTVQITSTDGGAAPEITIFEFLNYLLDLSIRGSLRN